MGCHVFSCRFLLLDTSVFSTPVRGWFKEARWVLRKIIPGVIKITPSGFGVRQLAFIKASYIEALYFDCRYYTSINITI